MVTCIGGPAFHSPSVASGGDNVSALEGRIQQARVKLNDWTSCVSAKTPKGQAEIQKLSGEISADQQKIARSQQSQASATPAPVTPDHTHGGDQRGMLVDAWA